MPYIDHTDLVAMVKTLIDDAELLKRNQQFYVSRIDSQGKRISELESKQYKGQDD